MFFTHKNTVSVQFTTFHTKNLIVVIVKKRMVIKFVNNLSERIMTIITTIFNYLPQTCTSEHFEGKKCSYFDLLKDIFKILFAKKETKKSSNTFSNFTINFFYGYYYFFLEDVVL